eukprot:jgi/Ulvmu1/10838/UM007_0012.1
MAGDDTEQQLDAGPSDGNDITDPADDTPDAAATREKLNQALIQFWRQQLRDVHVLNQPLVEFKNHPLPLARIKKIMKSDEDVRMISSEAPVLFAKACELFILELTHRAWAYSEANKRRTLQHNDLVHAICNHENEVFEFLTDNISPAAVQAASDGTSHIPPAMYATMAAASGAAPGSAPQMPVGSPFIVGSGPQPNPAQAGQFPNNGGAVQMQVPTDAAAQAQPGAQPQVMPGTQGAAQAQMGMVPQQPQMMQYVAWQGQQMPGQPMVMPAGAGLQQVMASMPSVSGMQMVPGAGGMPMQMVQQPGGLQMVPMQAPPMPQQPAQPAAMQEGSDKAQG